MSDLDISMYLKSKRNLIKILLTEVIVNLFPCPLFVLLFGGTLYNVCKTFKTLIG